MSEDTTTHSRTRRIALLLLGVAIVGVIGARLLRTYGAAGPELPVLGGVPDFSFVDQSGQAYGSADLAGKVWVASFIYTSCPGPCPRLVAKVKTLQRRFSGNPDFALVSFSVDPQTDTVETLGRYADTHAIDPAVWKLLTGPTDAVLHTIRSGFFMAVARTEEVLDKLDSKAAKAAVDPDQGPISHSVRLVLVDRDGKIRGFFDSNDESDLSRLGTGVETLLHG